jgi:hypothetical protein
MVTGELVPYREEIPKVGSWPGAIFGAQSGTHPVAGIGTEVLLAGRVLLYWVRPRKMHSPVGSFLLL